MDKTERPTSTRLEELREKGIVPYSSFAARSTGALMVLIMVLALRGNFEGLIGGLRAAAGRGDIQALFSGEARKDILSDLFVILLAPGLAAAIGAFLAGLFQTRFFFHFGQVSPTMSRINPFSISGPGSFFFELGIRTGAVIITILLAVVFLRLVISDILALANGDIHNVLPWLLRFLEAALPLFIPLLAFSGFLSWLLARHRFMLANRMTREEVLRENEERR